MADVGGESVDRISHLPPDVTDCILRFLPLKYAVRMSILSTYWRYKWALLPQLILGSLVFSQCKTLKYTELVNKILLLHTGPIHNFSLVIPCRFLNGYTSQWIQYVSGKSVKEFTLFVDDSNDWIPLRKLPSCMFSCVGFNDLTHLTLTGFNSLSLPSTFQGFPFLISLTVNVYHSKGEMYKLESIVSKCPQLERLNLDVDEKESSLTINAPKVENLVLIGKLFSIHLQETTKVKTVFLTTSLFRTGNTLILFLRCFPNVEKLVLDWQCWKAKGLSHFELPKKLKNTVEFRKLQYLQLINVGLTEPPAMSFILALFQMAPIMQKLEIDVLKEGENEIVMENCHMGHLKSAKIRCVNSSFRLGLQLTKLILSSSPALETMNFERNGTAEDNLIIAKELLRYHRASAVAQTIFET